VTIGRMIQSMRSSGHLFKAARNIADKKYGEGGNGRIYTMPYKYAEITKVVDNNS